MASHEIRVVAVDEHPLTLLGIERATRDAPRPLRLVGAAHSVAEPETRLMSPEHVNGRRGRADVAVLGLRLLDGSSPTDNVRRLRSLCAHVLVQSDGHHVALMSEAVGAGARGIVFKHQPIEHFLTAVTAVGSGESYLSVELASLLHTSRVTRPQLTTREIEVLTLLYSGMVSKQVARKLDLAESTVKEHLKRIRSKYAALGRPTKTRIELLQRAVEDGYVEGTVARGVPGLH
jgi:DNA-binding NarL/FixJ family response regulator